MKKFTVEIIKVENKKLNFIADGDIIFKVGNKVQEFKGTKTLIETVMQLPKGITYNYYIGSSSIIYLTVVFKNGNTEQFTLVNYSKEALLRLPLDKTIDSLNSVVKDIKEVENWVYEAHSHTVRKLIKFE